MDNTRINQEITSAFGLDIPPVAMAFVDEQPQGVESIEGEVPLVLRILENRRKKNVLCPGKKAFQLSHRSHGVGFRDA